MTMSPTLLSKKIGIVELYIYGATSHYEFYKALNDYCAVLGIFLTIAGFVLVVAFYYHHEET
jgi:hypothetical protein